MYMNMTTVIYQRLLSRYIVFFFLVLIILKVVPEAIIDQGDDDLSISDGIDEDAAAILMTIRQIELQHAPISRSANSSAASAGGLIWSHLSVPTTSNSHDSKRSFLLHDTSGMVADGRILGIIGPSGSGKTVLLQTLLRSSVVSSSFTYRNHHNNVYQYRYHPSHHSNHSNTLALASIPYQRIAYISQTDHDAFFDQLTVYETLQFAYFIETMSRPTSCRRNGDMHQPNHRIQSTINQLGLQHVTHHQIGSSSSSSRSSSISSSSKSPSNKWLNRWIPQHGIRREAGGRLSGGERRRLSVGLELVASREDRKKLLLLADEPTSGLDSTYSRIVLTLLRTLVRTQNIPALIALHQPSSYIWNHILDDILLLAPGGYVCYIGRRDMMLSYFEQIGYAVPEYTNPSEFFLELVSIHTENTTQAALDEERIRHLYNTFHQHQQKLLSPSTKKRIITMLKQNRINVSYVSSLATNNVNVANTTEHDDHTRQDRLITTLTQLPLIRSIRRILALFRRSWRQNIRDVKMNLNRLCVSVGNAFLLAGVFPSVQKGSQHRPLINSIADRVALLSFGAINLCMMTYVKSITLFAHESPIIQRELNAQQQYTVFEYLIAKVTSELPIDMIFSLIFAVILKHFTGLRISLQHLSQVFALLTTAGATLGFLLGSTATSYQHATNSGIPVLVILMVVGVINPSGVDVTKPKPILLRYLKQISPFAYAIEALCIAEYQGVQFYANDSDRGGGRKLGGIVARLKDAPRMGGLAMITVCCTSILFLCWCLIPDFSATALNLFHIFYFFTIFL